MAPAVAEAASPVAIALEHAATELWRFARNHKAQAAAHRRSAQQAMEALTRLRRECEAAGIHLVIAQEAETHERNRDSS